MEPKLQPDLRAGDADRGTAMDRLGAAFAEGRLDLTEYDRRLSQASTATTFAQLDALTADLPASSAPDNAAETAAETAAAKVVSKAAKDKAELREWIQEWQYWLGGAVIMTGIWGISSVREGEAKFYWPLMPLGIWAAILVAIAIWPSDSD